MKKCLMVFFALTLFLFRGMHSFGDEKTMRFGGFGSVSVYFNTPIPPNVVIFISGDGGWNLGVIDMAKELASLDALVVGVDIVHYLNEMSQTSEKCLYPAGDFELLSKFVQQTFGYPAYVSPVLVGYSSGATLVYAAVVQAPSVTFKGAISLGFCPDLQLAKRLCHGEGLEWTIGPQGKGYSFLPAASLGVPWVVLQGLIDQVCNPADTEKFVTQVKNSSIIKLLKVGHGFSVKENWMPEFKQAFLKMASAQSASTKPSIAGELSDLPFVEVPAAGTKRDLLAVLISGDGGWATADIGIAQKLAEGGIPVIGWNSLKYFWHARTPDETTEDLKRILLHYLPLWHKERVVLIGYSFGADVLPVLINRLPSELRSRIYMAVLISASHYADFKFRLSNWIGGGSTKESIPTLPEVQKLYGMKILCAYGEHDEDVLCKDLDSKWVKVFVLKGGHNVGKNYPEIADAILGEIE